MLRIVGNSSYGDALEKAFFNAAPGAVNRTFSGHVYFQSPNLVQSTINKWPFNWPSADTGNFTGTDPRWVESWYHTPPCCTGNQVRMLPNFIHHMWFGTPDGGIAASMHGPSVLDTTIGSSRLRIEATTNYPFAETVSYKVVTQKQGITFPLKLRIPHWCANPSITLDGQEMPVHTDDFGFAIVSTSWKGTNVVTLHLPMTIRATQRTTFANGNQDIGPYNPHQPWARFPGQNGTSGLPFCVVEYGPLTFALPLETGSKQHVMGSDYSFALQCNASTMTLQRGSGNLKSPFDWPLSQSQGGLTITAQAAKLSNWTDAWALPQTPIDLEPTHQIELIPYGNAKQFHISMFPVLGHASP